MAHFHECAYAYDHGSWSRISSIPYVALEFATLTLRASEGAFVLTQSMSPSPTRTWSSVARAILQIMSEKTLGEIRSSCLDRGSAPPSWAGDAAQLSAALSLAAVVLFSRTLTGGHLEICRRSSAASTLRICTTTCQLIQTRKERCDRRAKSHARNCYAFAPVKIDYMVPDLAVVRMG